MSAPLTPRQAAVLAYLGEHPGLTAPELGRAFGRRLPVEFLRRLEQQGAVTAEAGHDPQQGRPVYRWAVAPPGTVPPPHVSAAEAERRRRERERSRTRWLGRLAPVPPLDLTRAACSTADPGLFFAPDRETGPGRRVREEKAKAVCAGCEVRAECYAGAVQRREIWGIWGAVSFDPAPAELEEAS